MTDPRNRLEHMSASEKRALLAKLVSGSRAAERPASLGQRALWLHYHLDPGSPAYNVAARWQIGATVDVDALRLALTWLAGRHPALRTTFDMADGRLVQRVLERPDLHFAATDASAWTPDTIEERLTREARRPFDLRREPAFRANLFSRQADAHVLQLVFHHIVYDLQSGIQLAQELPILYESACRGAAAPPLPPPESDFADHVAAQETLVASAEGERQWAYWERQLADLPAALDFPEAAPRPAVQTFDGRSHHFELSASLSDRVREVARAAGTTPYVVMLTAFFAWLHRHTGEGDLLVGSPVAGRGAGFERTVGYFVNPLVLRARVSGRMRFGALLHSVRQTVLDAIDHGDYPFGLIVERLQLVRDPSRSPLFQAAFTWNKLGLLDRADEPSAGGPESAFTLPLRYAGGGQEGANFDVDVAISESGTSLGGWWRYNTDLFTPAAIADMASQYLVLLEAAMVHGDSPIAELPLTSPQERARLLSAWNPAPRQPRRADETLVSWFEAQVAMTPDSVAVSCGDAHLTYDELNRRANRIARRLIASGIGAESAVGLFMERSVLVPAAIAGILKAGAAYVPLDPVYPDDRVRFILGDASVRAVITDATLEPRLSGGDFAVIRVDTDGTAPGAESDTNPSQPIDPAALAYVIYTSGSTGRPKGVGVSHQHVTRLFTATDPWFGFNPADVWTLFHSVAFDFSVWEIWGALLYGGRLAIVPYWVSRAPESFRTFIAEEGVTVLNQTPSAFRQLIAADATAGADPLALRYVIFGGEALDLRALQPWVERHGTDRPTLVNMYGITETTVHVTYRPLTRADVFDPRGSVVGEPIPDLAVYVLDPVMEPVPAGMRGELFVGGAGVARGYAGRPRLTAERFVPDPFSSEPGGRLYRSGDLARRLRDGDLEYLGRRDQQVKIRGFRIELGEIQQALRTHPAVQDVVVGVTSDGESGARIVAHVVPDVETAGPVRRLLTWEREGRLGGRGWHELPNGHAVVELNRNETEFLYDEIFGDERYLRHGVALEPGACVFDVGANIGMFSLYVGSQYPGTAIYAFEPIPEVCDLLALNAELHGLDLRPMAVALSDREGEAAFTFYPKVSIFSGCFADAAREREVVEAFLRNQPQADETDRALLNELLEERLESETVQCPVTTVSAVMRAHAVERVDLLKVDVEKSELAVLQGVDPDDWPKIQQVIVEVHDEHGRLAGVRTLLERAGFQITVDQDPALAGTGLYSVYAVRAPRSAGMEQPALTWSSPDRLIADLRRHAGRTLPDYMMPSAIVLLDALPLTPNGKLDRGALPPPVQAHRRAIAPRTPLEDQVAAVWRDVLGLERVGVHDNFFALGGHSLLATKLISRLRAETSVEVPLRTLFEAPTVEGMAIAVLEQQALATDPDVLRDALSAIETGGRGTEYP